MKLYDELDGVTDVAEEAGQKTVAENLRKIRDGLPFDPHNPDYQVPEWLKEKDLDELKRLHKEINEKSPCLDGRDTNELEQIEKAIVARNTCNQCGRNVAPGSGWFVNRVVSLDTEKTRADCGYPFPAGEFTCAPCDNEEDENDE